LVNSFDFVNELSQGVTTEVNVKPVPYTPAVSQTIHNPTKAASTGPSLPSTIVHVEDGIARPRTSATPASAGRKSQRQTKPYDASEVIQEWSSEMDQEPDYHSHSSRNGHRRPVSKNSENQLQNQNGNLKTMNNVSSKSNINISNDHDQGIASDSNCGTITSTKVTFSVERNESDDAGIGSAHISAVGNDGNASANAIAIADAKQANIANAIHVNALFQRFKRCSISIA
jgi:hypothetical protein